MDVTRANFQEVLSELDDVLEDATFLSIDGEFTGLNSGPDASAFDTPSQYYSKLLNGSMDFLLVQFGLSVFTYNNENNKYSQRSYNFYVFPKPFNRSAPDCRFLCQASSITFLANRGFDFNKLFTEGIPYLTRNEEDILNKKMEEKQKMREEGLDYIHISDDDRPQIEDICTRIEKFLEADADELQIDKCNAFIRRLVYQETKVRWPNKVRVETINDNGNQYIIIYKLGTEEEEEKRKLEKIEREKQEVQDAVGLSALLRKIADSGKVLIGHNMLLDLCHIIHQFFGPLPQSYTEFKSLVHGLFPQIYDTKIICQLSPFKDSVPSILNYLFDTVSISPFSLPEVEMIKDRSYTINKDKLHEAGYDAFITGLCFIAMCDRLGALQNPKIDRVLANSPILQPYLNKLLIARLKDYPYIHLTGKDPNPSRDHVFHITFSKDWRYSDLAQLFMPYGGAFISWLSDTTAYVGLHKKEQAKSVIKDLFKAKNYSLQKYAEHQACLNNKKSVNSERKRKMYDNPSSPEKSPSPKDSETSSSTKKQDDDGWEVATGKRRHKRKRI